MSGVVHHASEPRPIRLHNATQRLGTSGELATAAPIWSYAADVPLTLPSHSRTRDGLQVTVIATLSVTEGMVGVGIMDAELRDYLSSEVDVRPSEGLMSVRLAFDADRDAASLMVRNTSPGSGASRFRLLDVHVRLDARERRLLVPRDRLAIGQTVHAMPRRTGRFEMLISHSSRVWNAALCERGYLTRRFADPGRLRELPPFETLPPNSAPYQGALSAFRLELTASGVSGRLLTHHDSQQKVMHACQVGDNLVVCFDSALAVMSSDTVQPATDMGSTSVDWIEDPWFGNLHTVMAVDDRTCVVSSSSADAILWVDVPTRTVVRRWRLPFERYGFNYRLDETTWLSQHYIPNDWQLGHLNCAAPDGHGGVYCSVLGQGDICHVDSSGRFELLRSGYVGCHGIRYDAASELLYFCDSCGGRLLAVTGDGTTTVLFETGSRWLHDAVHLGEGLFALAVGDTNRLLLADTQRGDLVAEWDFSAIGGTVQFLSPLAAV